MAMMTGENEQGLRKILDMTRMMSVAILLLHFYYYCYRVFEQWQLTTTLTKPTNKKASFILYK